MIKELLTTILAFGLGAALHVVPLAAQEIGQQPVGASFRAQEATAPESLQEIYRQLADYWEAENARAISQLAREGKVYVVVQREGVSQRLAASQLQYLLEEIFETSQEVTFRFPSYSAYDETARTGYAVGERVYRDSPRIEARTDRVFVGARNERGRWVLTELRLTIE